MYDYAFFLKTIQIIALLCALFDKAGTGKDLQDIRHRKNLVRKHRSKLQNLKDKALCSGDIVEDNIEEWKMSQALSPWHPVMIIVPPTICDTWKRAFQEFSHFSVSLYRGKDRAEALKSIIFGSADILLVPKSAFQDDHRYSELEIVKWKMVIIDEFHNFKNFKAKLSEHLRELKQMHQPFVIGMTGKLILQISDNISFDVLKGVNQFLFLCPSLIFSSFRNPYAK
jgi:SNF2 family DNA or RNA helicase